MKIAIVENTAGLWDRTPHKDIEINLTPPGFKELDGVERAIRNRGKEKGPLWGSTVTKESDFIKTFDK